MLWKKRVQCRQFSKCVRSATEVVPLQQQISVESLAESLPDLQPAAPDVVLPIEQSHTISSQPSERSEETVGPVIETHKDGHYFLKVKYLCVKDFVC
jgi:hypothetical protein